MAYEVDYITEQTVCSFFSIETRPINFERLNVTLHPMLEIRPYELTITMKVMIVSNISEITQNYEPCHVKPCC